MPALESKTVPIVAANFNPLMIVCRDENDRWTPTIEQLNAREYDYVKLHRLSTFLDVGIRPFSLGVCFDGTLIMPATEKFREPDSALPIFNRTLCELLLGGIYCEAVGPGDIGYGTVTTYGYTRILGSRQGAVMSFHESARTKHIGTLDVIRLLSPEVVSVEELSRALATGRKLLESLEGVPREQLLHAVTFYTLKQWAESLIHSWITAERVLEIAWESHVSNSTLAPSKKRRDFLSDHRTWTAAAKLEVLYQKGILSEAIHEKLDQARRARNDLAHYGRMPSQGQALLALFGLFELASLCTSGFEDATRFEHVVKLAEARCRPELYPKKTKFDPNELTHWLSLPPIPGDNQWGDQPFEIIEDICLQPISDAEVGDQSSGSGS